MLFPKNIIIDFVSDRKGFDACPHCGETRVTDCIHGKLTFLCGSSGSFGRAVTKCQKDHWLPFLENKNAACSKSWRSR
jgi:hypothetical protein